jgi:hypothetical protein
MTDLLIRRLFFRGLKPAEAWSKTHACESDAPGTQGPMVENEEKSRSQIVLIDDL